MLLGFKPQFAPAILSKRKRHTIRAYRKIRPRVGELCHCYVGLRQKGKAQLLGRWLCVKVQDIEIHWYPGYWIVIDGIKLSRDELEALARSDGFDNFREMMAFWEGSNRLPFRGNIIHWDPDLKPAALSNTSTVTKRRTNKKDDTPSV